MSYSNPYLFFYFFYTVFLDLKICFYFLINFSGGFIISHPFAYIQFCLGKLFINKVAIGDFVDGDDISPKKMSSLKRLLVNNITTTPFVWAKVESVIVGSLNEGEKVPDDEGFWWYSILFLLLIINSIQD